MPTLSIELPDRPLVLLQDYFKDADGRRGQQLAQAVQVVVDIVNQTIPLLETALTREAGDPQIEPADQLMVYALRSLISPDDDIDARKKYQAYCQLFTRHASYQEWYDAHIVPPPPPPTAKERFETVLAALEDMQGTQGYRNALILAWRNTHIIADEQTVAELAEMTLKGVQA